MSQEVTSLSQSTENSVASPSQKRKNGSTIWNFFTVLADNKRKCKVEFCTSTYSSSSSNSTLAYHLQNKHNIKIEEKKIHQKVLQILKKMKLIIQKQTIF